MKKNKKLTTNQEYKNSDLEIADQMQGEILNNKYNKKNKLNKSNTEIELSSNFNPDDFE